jgi:hypothetical protein
LVAGLVVFGDAGHDDFSFGNLLGLLIWSVSGIGAFLYGAASLIAFRPAS